LGIEFINNSEIETILYLFFSGKDYLQGEVFEQNFIFVSTMIPKISNPLDLITNFKTEFPLLKTQFQLFL
jgi:hypothetical protein